MSPNAVRCHYVPGVSIEYRAAFGAKAHRPPRLILGHARMLPGLAFARAAWVTRTSVGPTEYRATKILQMPSVASTHRVLPSIIQLLLTVRLTGPPCSMLVHATCSPGRHLHGKGPRTSGGPGESPAIQPHQMSSVAATYLVLSSVFQLDFVLRLTGPCALNAWLCLHAPRDGKDKLVCKTTFSNFSSRSQKMVGGQSTYLAGRCQSSEPSVRSSRRPHV